MLVCGVGTGGTITGVGRYLKSKNPDLKVIAVEPSGSAVLKVNAGGPHKIYGWNGGFVASTTDRHVIDDVMQVTDEEAWRMTRELSRFGFVVGISSGATAHAAIEAARHKNDKRMKIATVFPDSGERYISILSE